jgi:hypothetical protein
MVKEFEMRKNASQMARAKIGKSGKINPRKLSRFALDNDIFQRITTVPQGKNHGLVIFIDLSGSMGHIIKQTFEQAISLATFCRKENLPFEILGFSDRAHGMYHLDSHYKPVEKDLAVHDQHFHIKQYLSSTMTSAEYRRAVENMLYVGDSQNKRHYYDLTPDSEQLSGTPLNETVIASIDIVSEFKSKYRLDIVNTIFLTDGMGGCPNNYYGAKREVTDYAYSEAYSHKWEYFNINRDAIYLQDKRSGYRVRIEEKTNQYNDGFCVTRGLIELAKKITGAKYTGYMISDRRGAANMVYDYEYTQVDWSTRKLQMSNLTKQFTNDGFISSQKFGFDEYFFVSNDSLRIEDNKIEVNAGQTKGAITRAFVKSLNKRGLQRMFLNKFVQNLAV